MCTHELSEVTNASNSLGSAEDPQRQNKDRALKQSMRLPESVQTGTLAKRENDARHQLLCFFFYTCDCFLHIITDVLSIKHQELSLHKQLFWKMKYMWSVLSMKSSFDVQLQQAGICSCKQRSRKGKCRFYRFIYLQQIP